MKNLAIKLKRKFSATNEQMKPINGTTAHRNSNKSDTSNTSGEGQNRSSTSSNDIEIMKDRYTAQDLLEQVPSFREVSPEKRKNLLIKKLRLCSVVFNFQNESANDTLGKEIKRQILLELVDYISSNKGWFNEQIMLEIRNMVSCNLFRSLPPSQFTSYDPEEDEPTLEASWPHLQIVYEFLLRFIVSTEPDPKVLKRHLNGSFILSMLDIFKSEDPREREYLKTILHRIYGKFMSLRSFIRKTINNVFYGVVYNNDRHNGIGELLEILGSIINGFALPLKMEHQKFLRNVLVPLHKIPKLSSFHQQLSYCITQFIDKDNALSLVIIGGILKFWPITSSSKEVLLLNELEEIIEITNKNELRPFLGVIFERLAKCITNQHFQVAERALFFWNNDLIGNITSENKEIVFPIIAPSLHTIKEHHWNNTVYSLSLNVARMLIEIDHALYTEICNQTDAIDFEQLKDERQSKWTELQTKAQHKTRFS